MKTTIVSFALGLVLVLPTLGHAEESSQEPAAQEEDSADLLQDAMSVTALRAHVGGACFRQSGVASYYTSGRTTACGEHFNTNELTAAHRTLPCGTRLRVTNAENGKWVDVVVDDRGPFVGGRIIDLSRAAFERISGLGAGVARISISNCK